MFSQKVHILLYEMVPKQILSHLYKPKVLFIINHVHRYCQRKPFEKRISPNIIFTCTYRKCVQKTSSNNNIGKHLNSFCTFQSILSTKLVSRNRL